MKKTERTKGHIERYVQYFRQNVKDFPTQREVSENLNIPFRTVQRYYKAGKLHQFYKVYDVRFSEGTEKFRDSEFDFWQTISVAHELSNAKKAYKEFMR